MRVLVCESIHEAGLNIMREAGLDIELALGLTRENLLLKVGDIDAIVIKSVIQANEELFNHAPKLRVIGRAGVGTDNIDLSAAEGRGMSVLTVPGGNADAAADFAVMQILCLVRKAYQAQKMVENGDFRRDLLVGRDMSALSIGLIGLGRVGSRVARRLGAFGCRLIAYDPMAPHSDLVEMKVLRAMSIDELLNQVDVLSLHVPLSAGTRGLIGRKEFKIAQQGLLLVNTSRGAVVDEEALVEAIISGHVAGAALDVCEDEPPFDVDPGRHRYNSPLLHRKEISFTPHMAASTDDAQRYIASRLAEKIVESLTLVDC